ncbi:MAG TPA: CAP domain-containing protein [Chitinophaga sp.]|uniref:CAP domain-containing protein n=1 Tax=Chitinophaga sp. TaxID=1869181 RepID=UPI002B6254AF|nr:CAP domain-containing protein [Chitinophaga sp.]HVI48851.1 CAP domain-containing protein [Chitinophaga sp.]
MSTKKVTWLARAVICCVLATTACKKSDKGASPQPAPEPVTKVGGTVATNLNESLILQLVNDVRTKGCDCGAAKMPPVPPLRWSDSLAAVALAHSVDMDRDNYFDHIDKTGNDPGQRATQAGYAWRAVGENIARGQRTEAEVVNAWLKSPGHCTNLMEAGFKEMGVARTKDQNTWTQLFGTRK